jgi:hypothetical protein
MKKTIITLSVALLVAGGMMLRAQEGQQGTGGAATATEESKTSLVDQCSHMCAVQFRPQSPASLLAWKEKLGLTDDQVASLKAVEEKAVADAKALLKPEQVAKLDELSKDMKPQSMMEFMQHCRAMMKDKGMMHGKEMMHGMKGGMCKEMAMCCGSMQEEAHH